jgi:hypothetical protein
MERMKREETLTAFRKDSATVIESARSEGMTLTDHLDQYTEPNKDDELNTLDWMLWKEGVNCHDYGYTPASHPRVLGDWTDRAFDNKPEVKLLYEKMADRWTKSLARGLQHMGSGNRVLNTQRATGGASMVSKIEAGTAMNLYDDSDFYRAELFGPTIDWMQVAGMSETTTADTVRKNKYDNTKKERRMKITPEGVGPVRMELAYSKDIVDFVPYGIAVEATYDFLNAEQTRMSAIMNAIDEIAIEYRTTIFEAVVKAIKAAVPSGNAINPSGSGLTLDGWLEYRKNYNHYSLDICLGNSPSITAFEKMIFGDTDLTLTHLMAFWTGTTSGGMNMPMLLNNQPMVPRYGWYDDLSTELPDDLLLTFDKMHSSTVYFKRSLDQDETMRDPEARCVTRFLNTQLGIDIPDPHGIYTLNIA